VPLRVLDQPPLPAHADRGRGARDHAGGDADHADPPPVEQAEPGHHRVARDGLLTPQLRQRQRPDLEPGVRVDEHVDPLAHRQPTGLAVPAQPLRTAARVRRLLLRAEDGKPLSHAPPGTSGTRSAGTLFVAVTGPTSDVRSPSRRATLGFQTTDW
jgi:hypothetical protein